jgi:hypothetical protein
MDVYDEVARLAKVKAERRGCDKCETVTKATMASPVQIILCPKCSVTPQEQAELTLKLLKEYKESQHDMSKAPVKKILKNFGADTAYFKKNFGQDWL